MYYGVRSLRSLGCYKQWLQQVDAKHGAAGPSSSLRLVGLVFGAGLLGAEVLAMGSKWKDTVVLARALGSSFANGISPAVSLFREVRVSAKCKNAALSARST